jgi:hypothetical protein
MMSEKDFVLTEDGGLIQGEQRAYVVHWQWLEQTRDDWVVLAKSTRDARPDWIEVILDLGGNDLAAWNGWVRD